MKTLYHPKTEKICNADESQVEIMIKEGGWEVADQKHGFPETAAFIPPTLTHEQKEIQRLRKELAEAQSKNASVEKEENKDIPKAKAGVTPTKAKSSTEKK